MYPAGHTQLSDPDVDVALIGQVRQLVELEKLYVFCGHESQFEDLQIVPFGQAHESPPSLETEVPGHLVQLSTPPKLK